MSAAQSSPGAVLITGASTGIGEACARRLDQLGFQVFAGVRNDEDADRLAAAASSNLTPIKIDVTDTASIAAAADTVAGATGGRLAGLVNNAGIAIIAPTETVPIDRLRQQLEVNLIGQVAVTQALLPMLREAKGRIVNISSVGGKVALPFVGPYAASKFGLEAISDSLRRELRGSGIEVAVVEPGAIATPIWKKGTADADQLLEQTPADLQAIYQPGLEAVRKASQKANEHALEPASVADVVVHALTAKRPRTRYPLGRGVRMRIRLTKLLPDRVFDRLVARALGM